MTGAGDLDTLAMIIARLALELPAEELPELAAALEAGKARVLARLVTLAIPQPAPAPTLVDAVELGRALTLPETWVRDAVRRGRIPVVHAGVHLRFDIGDVLAELKAGKAALPDREKLSQRGRRAVEHRIADPARAKKDRKSLDNLRAATSLLPRRDAAEAAEQL